MAECPTGAATNQGGASAPNGEGPRHGNNLRTGVPVAAAWETSASSGIAMAIGPLVRAPTAIAAQAATGRSSANQTIAAVVHSVSVLSKMAVRAYASGSTMVA